MSAKPLPQLLECEEYTEASICTFQSLILFNHRTKFLALNHKNFAKSCIDGTSLLSGRAGGLRSLLWQYHSGEAGLIQEVRQHLGYGSQRILSAGMLKGHILHVERLHPYLCKCVQIFLVSWFGG